MNAKINLIKGLALSGMLMLGVGLTSCREDKGVFDKSPEVRLAENRSELIKTLTSSEHGWALQLIAGENGRFGGFTCVMRFNDKGEVLASNEFGIDEETQKLDFVKSLYSIGNDRSSTLQFNTFNRYIHIFSRPNLNAGAGPGKGLEADFNFLIQGVKEDGRVIELIGEKRRTVGRLVRLHKPAEQYIKELNAMKEFMPNEENQEAKRSNGVRFAHDGKTYNLYPGEGFYALFKVEVEGEKEYIVPFWYTDKGLHLSRPIAGATEFIYDAATKSISTNTGIQLQDIIDEEAYAVYKQFLGRYRMEFDHPIDRDGNMGPGSLMVEFTEFKEKPWVYNMDGLPVDYKLKAFFNPKTRLPELRWQQLEGFTPPQVGGDAVDFFWGPLQGESSLNTSPKSGMTFKLVVGSNPETYVLKGNSATPESDRFACLGRNAKGEWSLQSFRREFPYLMINIKFVRVP